jgi:hypothetical protein
MANRSQELFGIILHSVSRINRIDTKTIPEKILKFNEEFGEFSQELIKLLGFTHKPYDEEHFIEESADSLQVLISIQLAACELKGIPYVKILEALLEKNKKWEAKLKEYTRDGNEELINDFNRIIVRMKDNGIQDEAISELLKNIKIDSNGKHVINV